MMVSGFFSVWQLSIRKMGITMVNVRETTILPGKKIFAEGHSVSVMYEYIVLNN